MNKRQIIENKNNIDEQLVYSWDNPDEKKQAIAAYNNAIQEFDINTSHSSASLRNFSNLDPFSSSRPGLTREDYGYFRAQESIPTKIEDIIKYADKVYHNVGIVRNIIDLMGDFACQGIRLSHKDDRIQKFYKHWFDKVNGLDRSERFLNTLFRLSNVVIRRQNAIINLKQRSRLFKTSADLDLTSIEPERNKIPINYVFLHPCTIDIIGGELSSFTNKKKYAIRIPLKMRQLIQSPGEAKEIIAKLPKEMISAAKTGNPYPLPENDTLVFHYKKDDWETWAYPMIHAISKDVILLDKLKLADIAALDGAISNIRIFKLGSLEHKIVPGRAMAAKLNEILKKHVGAGTIDLVWGPDIELVESKTQVHQFLGEEKYKPTLNSIFGGLGIPQTLTGFGTNGTTNNFISLKTLIQRLKYAREKLTLFWKTEIAIVQEAMGFEEPAEIEFDFPDLGDSDSEKALLIQLADRNLISNELLMERFGHNQNIEKSRIAKEYKSAKDEISPPKYGPYVEAEPEEALKKIALQMDTVSPEQLGVELKFGKSKPPAMLRKPTPTGGPKDTPQKGRPKNSRDSKKRKTKTFKPKTKASVELWAKAAQDQISQMLYNPILQTFNKKNIRSLSDSEHKVAEEIKFNILLQLEPLAPITNNTIANAFKTYCSNKEQFSNINRYYKQQLVDITSDLDRQLTIDELRNVQVKIYTEIQEIDDES